MICFSLRCQNAHEFESWFKDGVAYERIAASGMIECPICGDAQVTKALMAPAIAKVSGAKGRSEATVTPTGAATDTARMAAGPMPAQMVALLQRMRSEVEKSCEYVGPGFAEEARRIHTGEAEARGIYGEASDSEADQLRDDGIDVARLPWVPRADG